MMCSCTDLSNHLEVLLRLDKSVQEHIIGSERRGLARDQDVVRFLMVLGLDDDNAELVLVVEQLHRRSIGGAAGDYERLAGEVAVRTDARAAFSTGAIGRRRSPCGRPPGHD